MNLETWLLFSGAALIVILIPGPLSLLMISNSLNYGLRRSYPAFLGGVFASVCLLSASALGLGALGAGAALMALDGSCRTAEVGMGVPCEFHWDFRWQGPTLVAAGGAALIGGIIWFGYNAADHPTFRPKGQKNSNP